ncbi:MAG: DNA polymerase III subunit beta [Bacteroidaceae bacterium]|nr:DNA polymerase III subunit beta [Bacteroidaceae bacterium]
MRIQLSSDALNNRLSALAKTLGSSNKNSASILNSFLFQVTDNELKITASDSENTMTTTLPLIESESNGMFALNGELIINAVKELAEQPIDINIDNDTRVVKIVYANGVYDFIADDPYAYPQPQALGDNIITKTMPSHMLLENLERTIFATGDDALRLVMNGVYFDFTTEYAAVVASDGHKLVRNKILDIKTEEPTSFILPKKPAQLLKSSLNMDDTDVTIQFDGRNAVFSYDSGVLNCRLIEGRYPNYNSVIPKDNPYLVAVEKKSLLGALKRVLPFASDSSQLVRLDVEENKITIKSEDLEFATKAVEQVACGYVGNKVCIGFKGSALQAVLSNLNFDEITLCIGDPSRPCLVLPAEQPEGQDVLMLLMPMLLND